MRVHLDPVVLAATLIRWLEGSTISRAGEGEELIESIAQATEGTAGAIDGSVTEGLATVLIVLPAHLLRNFHESVEDVVECPAQLAGGRVGGARRCLDVGGNEAAQSGKGGSDDEEFFHAGSSKVICLEVGNGFFGNQ